ncbi:hypothetical protein BBOR36S_00833 [Brevibacillus borstelensis]|jgi:hypothetical protein
MFKRNLGNLTILCVTYQMEINLRQDSGLKRT